MLKSLMKAFFALTALVFASANFADEQQALQLAQADGDFDVEARYMATCFACHSTGAGGAPITGQPDAWTARLEAAGMDGMVDSVINGLNTMPPKGLCFDCTDDQLRQIVQYMVDISQ